MRESSRSQADEPPLICVVEVPKGSRNKYRHDPDLGGFRFERLLMSAATYPGDYGYLRETAGPDGAPLSALVCLLQPTFPGCLIPVRAICLFEMTDEKGVDDKVVCVPLRDPYWNGYEGLEDLPDPRRLEIEQFFAVYKQLEPGKHVTVKGWRGRENTLREIQAARERYAGVVGR